jgi:hypothetical protein
MIALAIVSLIGDEEQGLVLGRRWHERLTDGLGW